MKGWWERGLGREAIASGYTSRAIEIPPQVGRSLGFDWTRSWINTSEVNTFTWPDPDVRGRVKVVKREEVKSPPCNKDRD